MITIKVKQEPNEDWPDGWAVFYYYDRPELAQEHWDFLISHRSDAVWIYEPEDYPNDPGITLLKTLKHGREV